MDWSNPVLAWILGGGAIIGAIGAPFVWRAGVKSGRESRRRRLAGQRPAWPY